MGSQGACSIAAAAGGVAGKALTKLSFMIRKGDRVALLGHNGARKSTLLRLLSNIYCPTHGQIRRHGRVMPLINKSFWVDTDLSSRYAAKAHYLLNRNISMGVWRLSGRTRCLHPAGGFIHLPIRNYSDGMRTHLQFGLLTAFRQEPLALDKGIGAGYQWFVSPARVRLSQFLGEVGTLILASHSNELLGQFCTRGLVLEDGDMMFDGSLQEAFAVYHQGVQEA